MHATAVTGRQCPRSAQCALCTAVGWGKTFWVVSWFFYENRRNLETKNRSQSATWTDIPRVHPCLDYTLMDYSHLDDLCMDYKDSWTTPNWTTYGVWTTAVWTTNHLDYTQLDYL